MQLGNLIRVKGLVIAICFRSQTLFELPDKIRYDSIVMAFVRPTSEDKKAQLGKQSSLNGTANGPGIGTTSGKNSRSKPDRPPRLATKIGSLL